MIHAPQVFSTKPSSKLANTTSSNSNTQEKLSAPAHDWRLFENLHQGFHQRASPKTNKIEQNRTKQRNKPTKPNQKQNQTKTKQNQNQNQTNQPAKPTPKLVTRLPLLKTFRACWLFGPRPPTPCAFCGPLGRLCSGERSESPESTWVFVGSSLGSKLGSFLLGRKSPKTRNGLV